METANDETRNNLYTKGQKGKGGLFFFFPWWVGGNVRKSFFTKLEEKKNLHML
jgi:hypothetical protein